jgi:hypothetical protein
MPFDGPSGFTKPATATVYPRRLPTLGRLAHLLRHPERWPSDFQWDYSTRDTCAIGLCNRLYGRDSIIIIANGHYRVATRLWLIFNTMHRRTTANEVADAIDVYLDTERPKKKIFGYFQKK